jgi:hypothetical protein
MKEISYLFLTKLMQIFFDGICTALSEHVVLTFSPITSNARLP